MKNKKIRTPDEVRREFRHRGISIASWARENGISPRHVYDVLGGRNKGLFGESHRAAVLLGIKDGEGAGRARGAA